MIYVASRTKHAEMWKGLRASGVPIISTWIDEAGAGETDDLSELWVRIAAEIYVSKGILLYAEPEDFPLKGALIECGIGLGCGVPVALVLPNVKLEPRSYRPVGSWMKHPNCILVPSIRLAVAQLGFGWKGNEYA